MSPAPHPGSESWHDADLEFDLGPDPDPDPGTEAEQGLVLPGPGSGVTIVRADLTQYMGLPEALSGRCAARVFSVSFGLQPGL